MTSDPTNAERQRLYRARRKAEREGNVEVTVGGDRFWVPPKRASKVRQWLAEAERDEKPRQAAAKRQAARKE